MAFVALAHGSPTAQLEREKKKEKLEMIRSGTSFLLFGTAREWRQCPLSYISNLKARPRRSSHSMHMLQKRGAVSPLNLFGRITARLLTTFSAEFPFFVCVCDTQKCEMTWKMSLKLVRASRMNVSTDLRFLKA